MTMRSYLAAVLFSVAALFTSTTGHAADAGDLKSQMVGKWAFVMGSNTGDMEFTTDGKMIMGKETGPSPTYAMKGDEMTITFPNGGHARAKVVFVNPNEMHHTDLDQGFTIVLKRR